MNARRFIGLLAALVFFFSFASVPSASAQITATGQVVGTVQDPTQAPVPGAALRLENLETKLAQQTATASDGGFVFPAVSPGTYTLTVTMKGFDTKIYKDLVVNAGRTTNQLITLKVGTVNETIEVRSAAPVLQTTATTVASTVDQKYLQNLPLAGRDTLPFALLSAGAQQGVTSRDSTFEGMPGAGINITLNGVANNAERFKSGGTSFFAFVSPRLESVQEVTIATSNLGADSTGQGSMQIEYVTKSGTNAFHGEAFWQHSNAALNANDWFLNARGIPRPGFIRNDQGGALGGPIIRNRLFFFGSYAQVITPQSQSFTALVLTPEAQTGTFSYVGSDGATHNVDLLQLAQQNGFPGSVNSVIGPQIQKIQSSTSAGKLAFFDPNRDLLSWVAPSPTINYYPTARIDYQPTPKLLLSVSDTWSRTVNSKGFRGTVLPGIFTQEQAQAQIANPYIATLSAVWTLRPNMINEAIFGTQSNQETFGIGFNIDLFKPRLMNFPLGLASGLEERNGQGFGNTFQPRNNPIYNFVDNFHWQHGVHSFTFGGNMIRASVHQATLGDAGIPRYNFGVVSADPANSMFTASNFPNLPSGATGNNVLNDARNLYALLTGRVSSVTKTVNIDEKTHQFADFRPVMIRERESSFGLYFADSWRVNHSLTLNYGLRWDFQGDNENTNGLYTSPTLEDLFGPSGALPGNDPRSPNLFSPGSLLGIANPSIFQRSKAYNADYINPAPHVGVAWNPSFQQGLLAKLFGDRKTVIRTGYSINYYSEGLLNFSDLAGSNPGLRQSGTLAPGVNFKPGSLSVSDPLPAFPLFPPSFSFPLPLSNFAFRNQTVGTINPALRAPFVQTWSFGIQRELRPNTAVEIRYAGNYGTNLWHAYNVNEINIFENHFLDQFKAGQNNLAINATNSTSNSFSDQTGFSGIIPTPIFDAAFQGLAASAGFSNSGFINLLNSGQAGALANALAQNSTYLCPMVGSNFSPCAALGFTTPGQFPANFFQLNPFIAGANLLNDNSFSSYHGLQIEFRERFFHGLVLNANYTWSHSLTDRYNKNVDNSSNFTTLRNLSLDRGPSPFDIRHVFQVYGTYDLPFGRGRHFDIGNSVLDGIAGGWTLGSIFRLQSGLPFKLSSGQLTVNQQDSGVVAHLSASQLQSMVGVVKPPVIGSGVFFINPALIGPNGQANPADLSAPTTPGQFGDFVYLHGPKFVSDDLSISKEMPVIPEKLNMEFRAEMVNAFNHPIFQVPTGGTFSVTSVNITSNSFGRTSVTTSIPRQVQFRLRFTF